MLVTKNRKLYNTETREYVYCRQCSEDIKSNELAESLDSKQESCICDDCLVSQGG
jgi:hypothetical protein